MNSASQVIAKSLAAFLEKDKNNRQVLVDLGIKSGIIDQIIDGTVLQKNLLIVAQRLNELLGIDIREIYFTAVRERYVAAGTMPESLADIVSFAKLAAVFGDLLATLSRKKVLAYFDIADKSVAVKWITGWPSELRIEQMFKFIRESREGTIVIPELPAPQAPPPTGYDWRSRLRELRQNDPKRYRRPNIAARLGVPASRVKSWLLTGKRGDPTAEELQRFAREFPEVFVAEEKRSEGPSQSGIAAAPVSSSAQQKALSSLVSMMFSAINVVAAVVDPKQVVDGDKARIVEVVSKLFAATGIDRNAFARLAHVELLSPDDPALGLLFRNK